MNPNVSTNNSQRNISKSNQSYSQQDFNRFDFDADCNENKYVCGCGKVYGSYPAFSTHRKSKHNNQTVLGTKVPKNHDPKRGRPSYEFKKLPSLQLTQKQYYSGLSSIQLGLLSLEQKYIGRILRSHQQDFKLQIPSIVLEKVLQNEVVVNLIKFTELITVHMQDQAANYLIQFLTKLIIFGIENGCLGQKIFNQYFAYDHAVVKTEEKLKGKKLKFDRKHIINNDITSKQIRNSNQLSGISCQNKSIQCDQQRFDRNFEIEVCLILSEWMNKIGLWNYVIKRRE